MQQPDYYSYERKELYPFIPDTVKRSLDVGCAKGTFSERLKKEKETETWGIEMVPEVAEIAKSKLDNVLTGAFDDVCGQLPKKYFDCVFFNDVLEHMPYPDDCLMRVRDNIVSDGRIVASIPNMRYIGLLIDLVLKKDWEYKDSGIMDKTHLRFFTKKSMIRMFDKCGYEICCIEGINPISPYCLTSIVNFLTFNSIEDVKYTQFVIVAKPK